ncbi:MAG TPA: alpha/beta family hydrolase [Planctomycetota bacterium]|nr:alpha/beta family hydrolase [Planctomycetota bacterium]
MVSCRRRAWKREVKREPDFDREFELSPERRIEARWRTCAKARAWPVLLAHGAGAGHDLPLLAALERSLSAARFEILSFHYPYMTRMRREGGRRPPDPMAVLEAAHERALSELSLLTGGRRALLVGKSMGGRVGSMIAAKGAPARGLVLVGYPLHPAKHPEKERSEHFRALAQPALFLSGTRDALCELPLLRRALRFYGGPATLEVIEGADHDFKRPGAGGRDPLAVADDLSRRIVAWVEATWPD